MQSIGDFIAQFPALLGHTTLVEGNFTWLGWVTAFHQFERHDRSIATHRDHGRGYRFIRALRRDDGYRARVETVGGDLLVASLLDNIAQHRIINVFLLLRCCFGFLFRRIGLLVGVTVILNNEVSSAVSCGNLVAHRAVQRVAKQEGCRQEGSADDDGNSCRNELTHIFAHHFQCNTNHHYHLRPGKRSASEQSVRQGDER